MSQALGESLLGKAVSKPEPKPKSQAYGRSIHYGLGDILKNLFKPAG